MTALSIESKVVKIELFPCAGSRKHEKNHIYSVDEYYSSGRQVQDVDFMTLETAQEKYGASGLEVKVTNSHGYCIECTMENFAKSREAALAFFPNYRGN